MSALLELILCLGAVVRSTGLRLTLGKWLMIPALASALSGLNARLMLRILQNAGLFPRFAPIMSFAFAAAQYGLIVGLLGKRIDENA